MLLLRRRIYRTFKLRTLIPHDAILVMINTTRVIIRPKCADRSTTANQSPDSKWNVCE
jgi:hypothetical protein